MTKGKHELLQQTKEIQQLSQRRSDGVLPRGPLFTCHGLAFSLPLCALHEAKDFDFGGFEIFSAFFSAYTKTPCKQPNVPQR